MCFGFQCAFRSIVPVVLFPREVNFSINCHSGCAVQFDVLFLVVDSQTELNPLPVAAKKVTKWKESVHKVCQLHLPPFTQKPNIKSDFVLLQNLSAE